jgi:hypothetical protein
MYFRNALWAALLVIGSSAAVAEESCGLHAVNLLAAGKAQELAAMFATPSDVAEPLQHLAESLGTVTDIEETSTARFAQSKRISIQAKDLPPAYKYLGHWVNARSEKLGALQFQIARAPESTCSLLALHMDMAP